MRKYCIKAIAMFLAFLMAFGMITVPVSASDTFATRIEFSQYDESLELTEIPDFYVVLFIVWFEVDGDYLCVLCYNPWHLIGTQPDPFWNIHNFQRNNDARIQSSNLFVYTMNNPVRFIDPSGMVAMPVALPGLGPAATAIMNAINQARSGSAAQAASAARANPPSLPEVEGGGGPLNNATGSSTTTQVQIHRVSNRRTTAEIFVFPLLRVVPSTIYAFVNSFSVGVEYGAGIGADVRIALIQGRIDPAVIRNTATLSAQGITHGEWTFHTGAFIGPQVLATELGGMLIMSADDMERFIGINFPGDLSLGWGDRTGPDFEISIGGSMYFGFGFGADVTFSITDFLEHLSRAMANW